MPIVFENEQTAQNAADDKLEDIAAGAGVQIGVSGTGGENKKNEA